MTNTDEEEIKARFVNNDNDDDDADDDVVVVKAVVVDVKNAVLKRIATQSTRTMTVVVAEMKWRIVSTK